MTDRREDVWAGRALTVGPIIDAHAHAGPFSLFFIPEADPAAMVRVMDRCGITMAVISANLGIQLDARGGNEATAAAVTSFPDRLRGYVTVNPWQDPIAEIGRWADDPRFCGIKIHPDYHAYPLTGSRYAPVWEWAAQAAAPVLTHTWSGSAYNDLVHVDMVAERHPTVRILAGHAGGVPAGIDAAIASAARHPNVYLEICTSRGSGRLLRRMVDEVGAGQVVFGSDFPFVDLRTALGRVVFGRLGDEETAAVLGGTMRRLLADRLNVRSSEFEIPQTD